MWLRWPGIIPITAQGSVPSSMLIKFVIKNSTSNQTGLKSYLYYYGLYKDENIAYEHKILLCKFYELQDQVKVNRAL